MSIISMQQRPQSNHHTSSRNDQCSGLSVALHVQCYDSVHRYLLPSQLCQSRLNGRSGSNACTVISVCVAAQIVQDRLQIPSPGLEPTQQTINAFIDCMEAGNRRYELSGCNGFVSVYAALGKACSDMPVVVAKRGDFGVWDYTHFVQVLQTIRDQASTTNRVHAGVLVMPSHFSVAIAFDPVRLSVAAFDSHSHNIQSTSFGASIAVAGFDHPSVQQMEAFLDLTLNRNGLANGTMEGADIILIASVVAEQV